MALVGGDGFASGTFATSSSDARAFFAIASSASATPAASGLTALAGIARFFTFGRCRSGAHRSVVGGRRLRVGSLGGLTLAAFLAFTAASTAATATATAGFAGLRCIPRRAACGRHQRQQLFLDRPRYILARWAPGFATRLGSPLGAALRSGRCTRVLPVAAGPAVVAATTLTAVRAIASLATSPGIVTAAVA